MIFSSLTLWWSTLLPFYFFYTISLFTAVMKRAFHRIINVNLETCLLFHTLHFLCLQMMTNWFLIWIGNCVNASNPLNTKPTYFKLLIIGKICWIHYFNEKEMRLWYGDKNEACEVKEEKVSPFEIIFCSSFSNSVALFRPLRLWMLNANWISFQGSETLIGFWLLRGGVVVMDRFFVNWD